MLQPCRGIPAIRFHPDYVTEMEGVKKEPVSPLQMKKLERELDRAKSENAELRAILARVLAEAAKVIPERKEGQAWGDTY